MKLKMRLFAPLLVSALAVVPIYSFAPTKHQLRIANTALFSTTAGLLPLDRTAERQIGYFQDYAINCGVAPENGFCLAEQEVDGDQDIYATTSDGASAGTRVLFVPAEMLLSSAWIAQEYQGYVDSSLSCLQKRNMIHLAPQFHLVFKILMEYEQGDASPYAPWLAAMPRAWKTAASMDDFCLACLPPYVKYVSNEEKLQVAAFKEALLAFEYISNDTKYNDQLITFAYNVVFTRAFPTVEGGDDYRMAPVVDMLNHGYPENAALVYDENENCQVVLQQDVAPGEPLTINYGSPYNPSKMLAKYGFLNQESPATFCKIWFDKTSQEMIDIGYDPEKMLYDTETGAIADPVWDVLLFSRLERKKELAQYKEAFYQACMNGDENTKAEIHAQFQQESALALLRHIEYILIDVHELVVKMNAFDSSKHPRIPMLLAHHKMVISTFEKVRENVKSILNQFN